MNARDTPRIKDHRYTKLTSLYAVLPALRSGSVMLRPRPACAHGRSVPLRSTPRRMARAVPRRRSPPALGVRRCKLLPPTASAALHSAARPARRSHRCGSLAPSLRVAREKQTPRTLAPAEHKARATIKSKSYKRQAQPAAPASSHTHQGQAQASVGVRALTRVRSLQQFRGWARSKSNSNRKSKGPRCARPST